MRFQRFGQRKQAEALVAGLAAQMQTRSEIHRLIYTPQPPDPGDRQPMDVAITRA